MWVSGGTQSGVWGKEETKGTTATESLDVSVTLPVSTMTHWHADCSDVALPSHSRPKASSLKPQRCLRGLQKQTTWRGGPREKQNHHHNNSLSHHPPLLSAQTAAAREPWCYWKNLVGWSGETKQKGRKKGYITFNIKIIFYHSIKLVTVWTNTHFIKTTSSNLLSRFLFSSDLLVFLANRCFPAKSKDIMEPVVYCLYMWYNCAFKCVRYKNLITLVNISYVALHNNCSLAAFTLGCLHGVFTALPTYHFIQRSDSR